MTSKLKEPHLLLASSNIRRLQKNLAPHLSIKSLKAINKEFDNNVRQLISLGEEHFKFAEKLSLQDWRQKVSRFYYATYNSWRAVMLHYDGSFSTESADHQKIGNLPAGFPNQDTYANRLKVLRDDRNIADYGHTASVSDLIISLDDARQLTASFISDAKAFLAGNGLKI